MVAVSASCLAGVCFASVTGVSFIETAEQDLRSKMSFNPRERIALFIDGANLYAAARSLGFDIDFKRLLDLFRQEGRLVGGLYSTALTEEQEFSSIRPLAVPWLIGLSTMAFRW